MIEGTFLSGEQNLEAVFRLREEIFKKEQGRPDSWVQDDRDRNAMHVLVFDRQIPVGVGRIYYQEGSYYLDRIGVIAEKRGQKIGDFIVRLLAFRAFQTGVKAVYACAPLEEASFLFSCGFRPSGEEFAKDGVQQMLLRLLATDCQSACCGLK